AITVRRPRAEVYAFWRDLENLPGFMTHVRSVRVVDERRSLWVAGGPAGRTVAWEAHVVEDRPGELVSWRSAGGAAVRGGGLVRFADAPGGRGTEVRVELRYDPPGGTVGAAFAWLFGEHPEQQLRDDLRRFKQVMETGEVVRSDGAPGGKRARAEFPQHPARPLSDREIAEEVRV
ncbi:MAG TPA: SRPBCC family protein, partial [Micromonosporaceae bacterium]